MLIAQWHQIVTTPCGFEPIGGHVMYPSLHLLLGHIEAIGTLCSATLMF